MRYSRAGFYANQTCTGDLGTGEKNDISQVGDFKRVLSMRLITKKISR
jgi:hypothetical protein